MMHSHSHTTLSRRVFLGRAFLTGAMPMLTSGCAAGRRARPLSQSTPPPEIAAGEMPQGASVAGGVRPVFPLPDLADHRVLRFVAGIRPFRTGRVRIEVEPLGSKSLIHNYGHGGAGLTLCWGSAQEMLRLVNDRQRTTTYSTTSSAREPIAVLGAGVIGLTAAHELLDAGHHVRIYTKATQAQTTSWIAGGQWAPSLVAQGHPPGDPDFFTRILANSHARFAALADEGGWGVFRRPNFLIDHDRSGEGGGGLGQIPRRLMPPVEWHDELPLASVRLPGRVYHTMLIEAPIFLPRLAAEVASLGGETELRTFTFIDELNDLPERIIINCLGLGARDIIDDARLVPMRGQLVYLQPQDLPYLLSHGNGYIFPRQDALVLGGTVERGVDDITPDEKTCMRILERNRRLFDEASMNTA